MRTAFSFAEVMFAVVILGIGFILIAAIFPVAIQQSAATGEESSAANIAREAAAAISALPTTLANPIYTQVNPTIPAQSVQTMLLFPPTVKKYVQGSTGHSSTVSTNLVAVAPPAIVVPLVGTRWDMIKANAVLPSDPRFAYAAFYKRENGSSAAELIVIAMTVRNRSAYDPTVDEVSSNQISQVSVSTTPSDFPGTTTTPPTAPLYTTICPDTASVTSGSPQEGYTVESTNKTGPAPVGRSYTLGRFVGGTAGYELIPGGDLALTAGTSGLWGTSGAVTDMSGTVAGNMYPTSTLQATVAYCQTIWLPGTPAGKMFLTTYPGPASPSNPPPPAAVPGAFVIIADDFPYDPSGAQHAGGAADYTLPPNNPGYYTMGALNGRIFRLSKVNTEDGNVGGISFAPGTFDLDPQYGMRQPVALAGATAFSPDTIPNLYELNELNINSINFPGGGYAKVYIIGAGRSDPTSAGSSAQYSGNAQDIGVFATYFQVQ